MIRSLSDKLTKKAPKAPKSFPDPSIVVPKIEERMAERVWVKVFILFQVIAVPHWTKKGIWVLPTREELNEQELINRGAHESTTLLWPRYWL